MKWTPSKSPQPNDMMYFRISNRLGTLYYDHISIQDLIKRKEFKKEPLFKRLILSYLERNKRELENLKNIRINSLEWTIYHLLSPIFPILWVGLKEDFWKDIFKEELGLDETVDFISFTGNSIVLIECIQKYTTSKGDVGEREVKKLLNLKGKLSKLGFIVYPILVCGENYEDNRAYFESKLREDIYFIFNEDLERIRIEMDLIKNPNDLIRYCKMKASMMTSIMSY
jgi:hypothetical protein